MPRMQVSFADAACSPGEAIRPGALATIQLLLEETMLIRVYRDVCDWVHPVFQQHVRPVILSAKQPATTEKYTSVSLDLLVTSHCVFNSSLTVSS